MISSRITPIPTLNRIAPKLLAKVYREIKMITAGVLQWCLNTALTTHSRIATMHVAPKVNPLLVWACPVANAWII